MPAYLGLKGSISLVLCLFAFAVASPAGRAEHSTSEKGKASPQAAKQGLGRDGRLQINASDRCPVCAMRVSRHPKFACAMELTDGRAYYFCGAGCFIRAWLHPEAFLNVDPSGIQRVVVQDYFSGNPVDGMSAVWVYGSDVVGPMGPAFVPLKSEADLRAFFKRHGGDETFRLEEITDSKWQSMTGKQAAP